VGFLFSPFSPSKAGARIIFWAFGCSPGTAFSSGGLMTGRMIAKYYPVLTNLE